MPRRRPENKIGSLATCSERRRLTTCSASAGTIQAVLSAVDADIVCLQEVKLGSLGAAERRLALCDGWDSFFALSAGRKYAGVATFCRHQLRPSAVAEGLTLPLTPSPEGPPPAGSHGVGERRVPTDAAGAGLGRGNPIYLGDTGEAAVLALLPQDIIATLESEGRSELYLAPHRTRYSHPHSVQPLLRVGLVALPHPL
eukprot:scaffold18035_cov106-Isochrysis_galbana.AAC.5